jgi:hypothetical protein
VQDITHDHEFSGSVKHVMYLADKPDSPPMIVSIYVCIHEVSFVIINVYACESHYSCMHTIIACMPGQMIVHVVHNTCLGLQNHSRHNIVNRDSELYIASMDACMQGWPIISYARMHTGFRAYMVMYAMHG